MRVRPHGRYFIVEVLIPQGRLWDLYTTEVQANTAADEARRRWYLET